MPIALPRPSDCCGSSRIDFGNGHGLRDRARYSGLVPVPVLGRAISPSVLLGAPPSNSLISLISIGMMRASISFAYAISDSLNIS